MQATIVRGVRWQVLGREVGTIYTRSELKHLIGIHVENPERQNESGLTQEDHQMLSGVLDYRVRAAGACLQGSIAWLHALCCWVWSARLWLTAERACGAG